MAWVKVDDHFADHPKLLAAGPRAGWLFVAGLCYCARLLTDGFIPAGIARRLADLPAIDNQIGELIDAGLWEPVEGGYRVHDYLDYQPSKERVEATREARVESGGRGGKQKSRNFLEKQNASVLVEPGYEHVASEIVPRTHPVPVPMPNPSDTPGEAAGVGEGEVRRGGSSRGKRATGLPQEFPISAAMSSWAGEHAPGVDLSLHHERFCNYWWGQGKTRPDWLATWKNWMLKEQDTANKVQSGREPRPLHRTANNGKVAAEWYPGKGMEHYGVQAFVGGAGTAHGGLRGAADGEPEQRLLDRPKGR